MKPTATSAQRATGASKGPPAVRPQVFRQSAAARMSDNLQIYRLGGSRTNLNVNQAREIFLKRTTEQYDEKNQQKSEKR